MESINIRFQGSANFTAVQKDLATLTAQFNALQKQMVMAAAKPNGLIDTAKYGEQIAKIQEVRKEFLLANTAQNGYRIESVEVASQTEKLTKQLSTQKLTLSDIRKNWQSMGAVYKDQIALRNSFVASWTDQNGKLRADVMIPKDLPKELNTLNQRIGFYNAMANSAAANTVKWGKNVQWAGRQLTVGFTVPLAAAAAATGVMGFDLNKSLTQIVKVYGDVGSASQESSAQIMADSTATAKTVAATYGQSAKDTLEITAQLAASGKTGTDLQQATIAVTRARMLGELNLQDAIKTTITLQSVYGASSKDLTNDFNYMNAMENSTVLTMQDFTESIPKASGILKALGGTLQDLGILMTAFKAGGIDAAEGANAIKSIAFKVISPTTKSIADFGATTHVSLTQIVKDANNQVVPALIGISKAMDGLGAADKTRLIKEMFGLFQGSKAFTVIDQLTSGSEQMSRAFDVSSMSMDQWSKIASQEVQQQTQSLSGTFKREVASIQLDLAQIGQTVLKMVNPVLGAIDSLLKRFDSLPDGVKKAGLVLALMTAAVGPVVMFTGLMANMIGSIGKFATVLIGLGAKFKIMDAEERAQMVTGRQAANVWDTETQALARLQMELKAVTTALTTLNETQVEAKIAAMPSSSMYQSQSGNLYMARPGQKPKKASSADITEARNLAHDQALQEAALHTSTMVQDTEKMEPLWRKIAAHAGILSAVAFAMGSMVGSSGGLLNNLMLGGFAVSSVASTKAGKALGSKIGSVASTAFSATMNTGIMQKATGVFGKGGGISKLFGGASAGLAEMGVSAGAAGLAIAGIGLAAGVVYMQIHKAMAKSAADIQAVDNSAQAWANAIGFAYTEAGRNVDKTTQKVDALEAITQKFRDTNKQAADEFARMNNEHVDDQTKLNRAIQEGIKVINHGGTKADAETAVMAALKLMGSRLTENQMKVQIEAEINFDDSKQVLDRQLDDVTKNITDAVNGKLGQSKWEGFARWFTGGNDLNAAGGAKVRDVAKEMWNIFRNTSKDQQAAVFKEIAGAVDAQASNLYTQMAQKYGSAFKKAGITSYESFLAYVNKNGAAGLQGVKGGAGLGMSSKDTEQVLRTKDALQDMVKQFGSLANVPSDQLARILDFNQLGAALPSLAALPAATMSAKAAQEKYNESIKAYNSDGIILNETQKLATLNYWRSQAGLDAATSSQQGFSSSVADATGKIKEASAALGDYNSKLLQMPSDTTGAEQTSILQGVYQGASNDLFSGAQAIAQQQLQDRQDAISAGAQRQDAVFDKMTTKANNRIKAQTAAVDAYYKRRIADVDKAIKAEQNAEAIRQKIFAAEQTRIQRMSEIFSKNIDFQSALNSGALDDAAKIQNDIMATQQGWNSQDAAASDADASQKKIDALNSLKDRLTKEQTLTDNKLAAQGKAEDAALAAQKKRYDERVQAAQKAATREAAINQRMLDAQLAALQAYIPTNETQLNQHIARIQAAYAKYGINLETQGSGWGQIVATALSNNVAIAASGMKNKIAWADIGSSIADQMVGGAFSLTMPQFSNWIKTGQLPTTGLSNSKLTSNGKFTIQSGPYRGKQIGISMHTGGIVGESTGSRVGHSGEQDPSEVSINALRGEGILNLKAMKLIGTDTVHSLNKGEMAGPGGLAGGMMGGMVKNAIDNSIINAGMKRLQQMASLAVSATSSTGFTLPSVGVGAGSSSGRYGGVGLSGEQLNNALTILRVGHSLGANTRDLIVSLMTAMQESTLRNLNYGDRDSLGLFQQRAGWGSVAERENPVYAATAFFKALFGVKNRNSMPELTLEAQAVQRSAFPYAYAKWQKMAESVVAMDLPKLNAGGITLNTGIAELHPRETVLTAPLSQKLNDGIDNMSNGAINYFSMSFAGGVNSELDLEKAMTKIMDKKERKAGYGRNIKNGKST